MSGFTVADTAAMQKLYALHVQASVAALYDSPITIKGSDVRSYDAVRILDEVVEALRVTPPTPTEEQVAAFGRDHGYDEIDIADAIEARMDSHT